MAATINIAASMLQVNSLSNLQTTAFPSLLEAVECMDTIHQSGGPEILPSILKRTFSYVEGINEPITKLTEIAALSGTSTLASPLDLAKEKKQSDLDLAQYDLEALRDTRQQLSERLERLVADRAGIAQEVSQISGSPGVIGPANRTPAARQAQLQQDLEDAGIPTRRDANNRAITECDRLLQTTNAAILQHTSNVRNLKQSLNSQNFTDAEIAAATATRQRMLSLTVGSASALNGALNDVITVIIKHYLVVQVSGLGVVAQGISQLEVLAGDSPSNTSFISVILRRQKAVKALRFLSTCFGGTVATDADNAARRIRDGSPAVFLQRVGPSAYSVVQGVAATPTDTYLERMLTAARSYEKVCLGPSFLPGQPNTQGSATSPSKHQELLLPGMLSPSSSPSPLKPSGRGFTSRPPSPMAFHIRDTDPSSDVFDVFTGALELGLPMRPRRGLAGNSTPSREVMMESTTKEHTREWNKDDVDREDEQEEQEEEAPVEVEPPASKKPKPSEAKGGKSRAPKSAPPTKGKPQSGEPPNTLFSPESDAFNNAATAFLDQLTSKLAGSPVTPTPVPQQQQAPAQQAAPQQQLMPTHGLPFPPGYMVPPFGFGVPAGMPAFFSANPTNVFGNLPPLPPATAPPTLGAQQQQNPAQSPKPYIRKHALSEVGYNAVKSIHSVCIAGYQMAGPCGTLNCNRTHAVSSADPQAQQCVAFNDMNSVCRTCFLPGGCPFRHVIMTWRDRNLTPPRTRFQRV